MRLIDADALIEDIEEYQKSMMFDSYGERMHFDDMIDFVVDHIEESPTIDAVPVVHATWEYLIGDCYCSACDKKLRKMSKSRQPKYCERCGARMDGKEDTDEHQTD